MQQQVLPTVAPPQPGTPTGSGRAMSMFDKQKYIEDYDFPYCDESSKYEKVAKIGQGTFGEVFKAREKKSNKKFVAMKKVLMENEKEGVSVWFNTIKFFLMVLFLHGFFSISFQLRLSEKYGYCSY